MKLKKKNAVFLQPFPPPPFHKHRFCIKYCSCFRAAIGHWTFHLKICNCKRNIYRCFLFKKQFRSLPFLLPPFPAQLWLSIGLLPDTLHVSAKIYAKKKYTKLIWEVVLTCHFLPDMLFFYVAFHSEICLKQLSKQRTDGYRPSNFFSFESVKAPSIALSFPVMGIWVIFYFLPP